MKLPKNLNEYNNLKAISLKLKKRVDKIADLVAKFNEKESTVLSIQSIADINKITTAVLSLQLEIDILNHSKLRVFVKDTKKLPQSLLLVRHNMRMLVGIIKGYSEMILEDLSSVPREEVLHKNLKLILMNCEQITGFIDDLREISVVNQSAKLRNLINKNNIQSSILIVDDSDANCELLKNWLGRKHYNTYIGKSGKQALLLLEQHPDIEIVLLDVMIPIMDGYEILTRIKSDVRFNKKSVIMISGMDNVETVVRCIIAGAEDYLVKPFNPYLLEARIYACLQKQRLQKSV